MCFDFLQWLHIINPYQYGQTGRLTTDSNGSGWVCEIVECRATTLLTWWRCVVDDWFVAAEKSSFSYSVPRKPVCSNRFVHPVRLHRRPGCRVWNSAGESGISPLSDRSVFISLSLFAPCGPGAIPLPHYPFTFPLSTPSFSIFYFSLLPFYSLICFLAFPSLPILPEQSHFVCRPDK